MGLYDGFNERIALVVTVSTEYGSSDGIFESKYDKGFILGPVDN